MAVRQLPVTGQFTLVRPDTVEEVFRLLREYGDRARMLSGGTDLLVQLRSGKVVPEVVIDLKRVGSLSSELRWDGETLEIGCLAILSDIISNEEVNAAFPVLVEAAATVGSVQIRNRATLAGNICNASPAADAVPALLVHGATVALAGPGGKRTVALEEFFVGPGKTVRKSDEIVTAIRLPKPVERCGAAFDRLTRRRGVDLATINVACMVSESGKTRFAYGAVGPCPLVVEDESGRLSDPSLDNEERARLIARMVEATSPISDVRASREYRAAMLLVLSRRTLETALARLENARGTRGA